MKNVLQQVFSDLQNHKLSHAVLLDGGTPEAREQAAREIASALVCSGQTKPCGVCPHCVKAQANAHPDILVFSGSGSAGSFKVDTVREIRQLAGILPNEADCKVFLLLSCESMLAGAQNALLKILEEPPEYVRFILTCSAQSDLLDTIRSRVTTYSLLSVRSADEDAAHAAAREKARSILSSLADGSEIQVLRQTAAFEKDKEQFRTVCEELAALCADVLVHKTNDTGTDAFVNEYAARMSVQQLLRVVDIAGETVQSIQSNINGNLLLASFCARLFADSNERV